MDINFTLIPQAGYTGNYVVKAYKQSSDLTEVASVSVGPMAGTTDPVTGMFVVPTTEPYTLRVFGCAGSLVSQFSVNTPLVCPLPGPPVASAITDTSGTFTWGAATPTPTGGYNWQLLLVHAFDDTEIVQSGNTAMLTQNITGMQPESNYIFRLQSQCAGSQSARYDIFFSTRPAAAPTGQVTVVSNTFFGYVLVRSTTSLLTYYCQGTTNLPYDLYEILSFDFDRSGCSGARAIAPGTGTLFYLDATHLVFTINITCT